MGSATLGGGRARAPRFVALSTSRAPRAPDCRVVRVARRVRGARDGGSGVRLKAFGGGGSAKEVKDTAVGSWLDLAGFVTSDGGKRLSPFDDLASALGDELYVDVNGWHLYLKDIKVQGSGGKVGMHSVIAQQIGEKALSDGRADSSAVQGILDRIPLSLGGGAIQIKLSSAIAKGCLYDVEDIVGRWLDERR